MLDSREGIVEFLDLGEGRDQGFGPIVQRIALETTVETLEVSAEHGHLGRVVLPDDVGEIPALAPRAMNGESPSMLTLAPMSNESAQHDVEAEYYKNQIHHGA